MHVHDKNRPCKKEGPAVEKNDQDLGTQEVGYTNHNYQNYLNIWFIFLGNVFFWIIFALGNF